MEIACQFRVANRSGKDIRGVVIDADYSRTRFGFLAYTPSGSGAAWGCRLRIWNGFSIEWEEDGVLRKVPVDIMPYSSERHRIRSMGFYYRGNGIWDIEAQAGTKADSPVIPPRQRQRP
jgi:hypothetical protein